MFAYVVVYMYLHGRRGRGVVRVVPFTRNNLQAMSVERLSLMTAFHCLERLHVNN